MELMLGSDMFDKGTRRIGAEQELFLIDRNFQPAMVAEEILQISTDKRIVNELTRFNLEVNLHPCEFRGKCLSEVEKQINEAVTYVRGLANQFGAETILTGILPTIHLSDLGLDSISPKPRYYALNKAIMTLKGGSAQFQIRGVDELSFRHETILVEGCNTSFQTHFQVSPEEFPRFYNIAQAVAGPCLALATNSPVLFGKRLWRETRIALFQQAVDTRSSNLYLREMSPRVHFGSDWVKSSVTEIYKEDITRFRVIMTAEAEDALDVLKQGGVPKLNALQLHNGTVYRWNRACYGITDGKPHLRIENRILPSGPTVVDEVANAAFWFGLVAGLAEKVGDVSHLMDFDDAKSNFIAAARHGLGAQLAWFEGTRMPAHELILKKLLPVARKGLVLADIEQADIDRYLGIIEDRVSRLATGAQWMLESLARMKRQPGTRADRLNAVVAGMLSRQKVGNPVHEWSLATLDEAKAMRHMRGTRVEHFMTTELFTVNDEELVELVASLMDWNKIEHVLVEDREHRLVGLVTHRNLLRYLSSSGAGDEQVDVPVKDIMIRNPITISPETLTSDAVQLMRQKGINSLPVVRDRQLVGIITERDFYRIAGELLDDSMEEE
ncbi:MAG: CBS domain-containing protein [Rhodothermales bacterium]|nr:CBS domain-containing protein [Rhodothermales bacterium]